MTAVTGPRVDPAPLFDLVTGFPPDDAVDLVVPMPLSLAIHMTMLESTGHGADLAVLHKLNTRLARETMQGVQARVADLTGAEVTASTRMRITHIVEQRVPQVNGLRPHIHAYVGTTVRSPADQGSAAVDFDRLAVLGEQEVFPDYRDRLVAGTGACAGLTWADTAWSSHEVVGPRWLAERLEALRHDDLSCPGPWPRTQIVTGRAAR